MKTSPNVAPIIRNQEAIVFDYINGAGNHELKTVLAGIVAANPDRFFTATTAAHELNRAQGAPTQDPVWSMKPAAMIQYFDRSLEPVGSVVSGMTTGASGKQVKAWRSNPENIDLVHAASGLFSSWSLRWPELSVQQAYGATTSKTAVRSPVIRHRIYSALTKTDIDLSEKDVRIAIEGGGYQQENSVSNQLRELADLGIIDLASKRKDYDPEVRINNAEYKHVGIRFEDTIPETRALYTVIAQNGVGRVIRVNALITQAANANPNIDTVKLREQLVRGLHSASGNYPGLEKVTMDGMSEEALSLVKLTPDVKQPIAELVNGVAAIISGEANADYSQELSEILASQSDVRQLVWKAKQNSHVKTGHDEGSDKLRDQLKSIITNSEPITAAEARAILKDQYGRRVTTAFVRTVLNELADKNAATKGTNVQHAHSTRKLNKYS